MSGLPEAAATERFDAVQAGLRCPACGGQRAYDAGAQALACASCGGREAVVVTEDEIAAAAAERCFDTAAPGEDEPPEVDHAHLCETCGGEVVFVGRALSERCPYCDGPVVLRAGHAAYAPSAVIPFAVDEAAARQLARDWIARRWAAPGDLGTAVEGGRFAGLYAPFWTFDSVHRVSYNARRKLRVGGRKRRWEPTSGTVQLRFDDRLMPASAHVTPLIRDAILHAFSPDRLRPCRAAFLAGFAAELPGQTVRAGFESNLRDMRVLVERRIRRDIGRAYSVRDIRYSGSPSSVRYRRVLLPVWIAHYRHRDRPMKVVVSGLDGRTFGERPFSRRKLLALSALVAVPAFLFGVIGGIAMAP